MPAPYGYGDWFVAMLVSSVVAWPAVFATDVAFGDYILPTVEKSNHPDGAVVIGTTLASLIPKAAGSYFGAHLYVPRAWWFYKLSLLPALPVAAAISAVYYGATWKPSDDVVDKTDSPPGFNEVSWQETAEEFPQVRRVTPTAVSNTAWAPSTSEKKSTAKRLVEAAPNPLQIAYYYIWPPPAPVEKRRAA